MKNRRRSLHHSNSPTRTSHDAGPAAVGPLHRQEPQPRRGDAHGAQSTEIIFGVEPVRELIAAAASRITTLYLKAGLMPRFAPQIDAVRASGGRVVPAASEMLAQMAGSEARHQGIIAVVREYAYLPLDQVLAPKPDPLLLIDGVTDPRNLGAILRSAECAGLDAIVLAKDHTVGLTPAAIKSSAGAWAHLKVARCGNVAQTLGSLKAEGYWVAAMDPRGETSLYDLDVSRRLALVLGSEGRGIREIVRKTADFVVSIPMYGRLASLNVAVAAALTLFEISRSRASKARA